MCSGLRGKLVAAAIVSRCHATHTVARTLPCVAEPATHPIVVRQFVRPHTGSGCPAHTPTTTNTPTCTRAQSTKLTHNNNNNNNYNNYNYNNNNNNNNRRTQSHT